MRAGGSSSSRRRRSKAPVSSARSRPRRPCVVRNGGKQDVNGVAREGFAPGPLRQLWYEANEHISWIHLRALPQELPRLHNRRSPHRCHTLSQRRGAVGGSAVPYGPKVTQSLLSQRLGEHSLRRAGDALPAGTVAQRVEAIGTARVPSSSDLGQPSLNGFNCHGGSCLERVFGGQWQLPRSAIHERFSPCPCLAAS